MSVADKLTALNTVKNNLVTAIKNKGGTVATETLNGCVTAISTIPTNTGITPSGNIQLTQSSSTDVTNYATATVKTGSATVSDFTFSASDTSTSGVQIYQSGDIEEKSAVGDITTNMPFSVNRFYQNSITASVNSGWISSATAGTGTIDINIPLQLHNNATIYNLGTYFNEGSNDSYSIFCYTDATILNSNDDDIIDLSSSTCYYKIKEGQAWNDDEVVNASTVSLSGTSISMKASVTCTVSEGWISKGSDGQVTIKGTVPTEQCDVDSDGDFTPSSGKLFSQVTVPAGDVSWSGLETTSTTASVVYKTSAGWIEDGDDSYSLPVYSATTAYVEPDALSNKATILTAANNHFVLGSPTVVANPGIPAVMSNDTTIDSFTLAYSSSLTYLNIGVVGAGTTTGTLYTTYAHGYASTSYYHRAYTATRVASGNSPTYSAAPVGRISTSYSTYPYAILIINRVMAGDTIYFRCQSGTTTSSATVGTAVTYDTTGLANSHKFYNSTSYFDLMFIIKITSATSVTFYPYLI